MPPLGDIASRAMQQWDTAATALAHADLRAAHDVAGGAEARTAALAKLDGAATSVAGVAEQLRPVLPDAVDAQLAAASAAVGTARGGTTVAASDGYGRIPAVHALAPTHAWLVEAAAIERLTVQAGGVDAVVRSGGIAAATDAKRAVADALRVDAAHHLQSAAGSLDDVVVNARSLRIDGPRQAAHAASMARASWGASVAASDVQLTVGRHYVAEAESLNGVRREVDGVGRLDAGLHPSRTATVRARATRAGELVEHRAGDVAPTAAASAATTYGTAIDLGRAGGNDRDAARAEIAALADTPPTISGRAGLIERAGRVLGLAAAGESPHLAGTSDDARELRAQLADVLRPHVDAVRAHPAYADLPEAVIDDVDVIGPRLDGVTGTPSLLRTVEADRATLATLPTDGTRTAATHPHQFAMARADELRAAITADAAAPVDASGTAAERYAATATDLRRLQEVAELSVGAASRIDRGSPATRDGRATDAVELRDLVLAHLDRAYEAHGFAPPRDIGWARSRIVEAGAPTYGGLPWRSGDARVWSGSVEALADTATATAARLRTQARELEAWHASGELPTEATAYDTPQLGGIVTVERIATGGDTLAELRAAQPIGYARQADTQALRADRDGGDLMVGDLQLLLEAKAQLAKPGLLPETYPAAIEAATSRLAGLWNDRTALLDQMVDDAPHERSEATLNTVAALRNLGDGVRIPSLDEAVTAQRVTSSGTFTAGSLLQRFQYTEMPQHVPDPQLHASLAGLRSEVAAIAQDSTSSHREVLERAHDVAVDAGNVLATNGASRWRGREVAGVLDGLGRAVVGSGDQLWRTGGDGDRQTQAAIAALREAGRSLGAGNDAEQLTGADRAVVRTVVGKLSKAAGKASGETLDAAAAPTGFEAALVGAASIDATQVASAARDIRAGIARLDEPSTWRTPTKAARRWMRAIDGIEDAMRKVDVAIPDELGASAHADLQDARAKLNVSRKLPKAAYLLEAGYPKSSDAGRARAAANTVATWLDMHADALRSGEAAPAGATAEEALPAVVDAPEAI